MCALPKGVAAALPTLRAMPLSTLLLAAVGTEGGSVIKMASSCRKATRALRSEGEAPFASVEGIGERCSGAAQNKRKTRTKREQKRWR